MRPRGVAGLVVAVLLLIVGLTVFKAQQAHTDGTTDHRTVTNSQLEQPSTP